MLFYCHFPDLLLVQRRSRLRSLYRAPLNRIEEASTGRADRLLVNSNFTNGAPCAPRDSGIREGAAPGACRAPACLGWPCGHPGSLGHSCATRPDLLCESTRGHRVASLSVVNECTLMEETGNHCTCCMGAWHCGRPTNSRAGLCRDVCAHVPVASEARRAAGRAAPGGARAQPDGPGARRGALARAL